MSINKILKDQDAWLKKAPQSFKLKRVKIEDLKLLRIATEQRIADVTRRIASLSKTRDAAVQRYNDAIAAEKAEIDRLQKELKSMPETDQ